jgi:hypothetical protein
MRLVFKLLPFGSKAPRQRRACRCQRHARYRFCVERRKCQRPWKKAERGTGIGKGGGAQPGYPIRKRTAEEILAHNGAASDREEAMPGRLRELASLQIQAVVLACRRQGPCKQPPAAVSFLLLVQEERIPLARARPMRSSTSSSASSLSSRSPSASHHLEARKGRHYKGRRILFTGPGLDGRREEAGGSAAMCSTAPYVRSWAHERRPFDPQLAKTCRASSAVR